jgi:hypothetical protein
MSKKLTILVVLLFAIAMVNSNTLVAPHIDSMSPRIGNTGTTVTIMGSGFGATQGSGGVQTANGLWAPITSWADGQIVCTVPSGAASGYFKVLNDAGEYSNPKYFAVGSGREVWVCSDDQLHLALFSCQQGDLILLCPRTYQRINFADDIMCSDVKLIGDDGAATTIMDLNCSNPDLNTITIPWQGSSAVIDGITLDRTNSASSYVGAIDVHGSSNVTISNCIIKNSQAWRGAGIFYAGTAGVIRNNLIVNNTVTDLGGAIWATGDISLVISGNVVANNSATNQGGGIFYYGYAGRCDSNTFVGNSSPMGSAIRTIDNSTSMHGNIFMGNTGSFAVYNIGSICHQVTCSDFWNNPGGNVGRYTVPQCPDPVGSNGNISVDPFFCDLGSHDYHLDSLSVCANAPGCGQIGALPPACTGIVPPKIFTLLLRDGSAAHTPIAYKPFKVYKVTDNPPYMSETYKGELMTDGKGEITLPVGWFNTDDWVKIEKLVHIEPAVKHKSILPNMYYIKLDNGKFNTSTGAISYHTLTSDSLQEVIVDHTTIMYDLLMSVEWDAHQQYLENLRDGLKYMSNYIYDVTDGQMCFDSIKIFDNKVNWDSADVKIYASNMVWPHVPNDVGGIFTFVNPINFPRKWFGNSDASRNGSYSENPLIFTAGVDYRTKCHEFGHYGLGFYDEYLFVWGSKCSQVQNYGFMEYQYDGLEPYASEMSSDWRYVDPSCRNTRQYALRAASCWNYLESQDEKSFSGLHIPIIKPSERALPPGRDYFEGPNNNMVNLNYDIGSHLKDRIEDFIGGAFTLIVINKDGLGFPIGNSKVTLFKNNRTWVIEEGNSADNGSIRCLGVNNGDIIRTYARIGLPWFYSEFVVGGSGLSRLMNFYITSPDGDSVEVVLRTVQGDYHMINGGEFEAGNSFSYNLRLNRSFSQNPSLEFYSPSGQIYNYIFSPVTNGYEVSISDSLGSSGMFSVMAVDDSGYTFFVNNTYTIATLSDSFFSPQIYGPEGACELSLDTLNTSFQKTLILSSDFPPLLNGLDSLVEQGGAVHSISAYPNISNLNGVNNYLVIRYSDIDLKNSPETNLKIFKWREASNQWEWMGGVVDTMRNEVTSPIQSLGIYAAFTTSLMRGDVNSDGKISLVDVIYLANYVLKGGPVPNHIRLGDVNCDSKYDLVDVILLARYVLFGEPFPC